MSFEIIPLAVTLGIDSFSAAFAIGLRGFSARRAFLFAFGHAFAGAAAAVADFLL